MITYHCYKTCPVCGKTTLRLIDGTPEKGLWQCEGRVEIFPFTLRDGRTAYMGDGPCLTRVDEREDRLVWKSIEFAHSVHACDPLAQTGAASRKSAKQRVPLRDRAGLCISCGKNDYCLIPGVICAGWERKPDPAPDLEAKKREFWEWVGELVPSDHPVCAQCPARNDCDAHGTCGDTLRAHYERLGGGR